MAECCYAIAQTLHGLPFYATYPLVFGYDAWLHPFYVGVIYARLLLLLAAGWSMIFKGETAGTLSQRPVGLAHRY